MRLAQCFRPLYAPSKRGKREISSQTLSANDGILLLQPRKEEKKNHTGDLRIVDALVMMAEQVHSHTKVRAKIDLEIEKEEVLILFFTDAGKVRTHSETRKLAMGSRVNQDELKKLSRRTKWTLPHTAVE